MSFQPSVKPQDLESVIRDLDGALTWLQTLGIQPDRTRFSEYRNTLDIVHKYRVAGKLKELPAIVPPQQYRVAFIESTQLIAISKTPKLFSGPGVREKVRIAVTGPVSPSDEKKGSSNARDILFELSTAAFFRARKIPVLINTDKDLILRISGCTIFAECKRPKSVNGVERSIKAATQQLIAHFKNSSRRFMPRGLIVLDISTVMNPNRNVLTSDSLEATFTESPAHRFLVPLLGASCRTGSFLSGQSELLDHEGICHKLPQPHSCERPQTAWLAGGLLELWQR
jgi:hypothetical protein